MEASGNALNPDENIEVDPQVKKAIEDRDKIVNQISESIKGFINDRDEAVKIGLVPSFDMVGYLYARIEDEKALYSLLQGYNHSNYAVIEFNKAGEVTTSDIEKKTLYQDAATGFKSAANSFNDSTDKCSDYLKIVLAVDMTGLLPVFNDVVQEVKHSAKKMLDKAEEAQQLANSY